MTKHMQKNSTKIKSRRLLQFMSLLSLWEKKETIEFFRFSENKKIYTQL